MSHEDEDDHDVYEGATLVNAAFVGTGALLVVGTVGAAFPDALGTLTAVVSIGLFVIGVVAFLWGYANGVARSREERITLSGLFFLSGTAPRIVRSRLRVALGLQVVIAVVAASIRPYTSVAFVVLAPMFGLGMLALWGARHGTFFAKDEPTPGSGDGRRDSGE